MIQVVDCCMLAQTTTTGGTVNIPELRSYKERGERFAMLTAYDYLTASALDSAGIPLLLVGDTLPSYPTSVRSGGSSRWSTGSC